MTDQPETAEQYCRDLIETRGITYNAEFVPLSQSRNAGEEPPTLNWRVTIGGPGKQALITDYMQGVGHLPKYNHYERSVVYRHYVIEACEKGRWNFGNQLIPVRVKPPTFHDVLYCLVSDAEVLEYVCFEDWAECYGYDTDSRKAEDIYKACLKIALQLRQLIDLSEAREAFEDY